MKRRFLSRSGECRLCAPPFGLVATLLLGVAGSSQAASPFNSVRIAYYQDATDIPVNFVKRAKRNGYNYVQAQFPPSATDSIFETALRRVHGQGLTLIPKVQTGSHWSLGWLTAFPALANFNRIIDHNPDGSPRYMGCPSFADEETLGAKGFNQCFRTFLGRLRTGMKRAGVASLPYVNIGHDEPVEFDPPNHLLAGYGEDVNGNGAWEPTEFSQTDRDFIAVFRAAHPDLPSAVAFRALMAREVYCRVKDVHTVLGDSTRVMLYADAWDPEQNGGRCRVTTFGGEVMVLAPNDGTKRDLADLPGLTASEQAEVRNSVALMLWQYTPKYGDADYNSAKAFAYFVDRGYRRLLYVGSMYYGDDKNTPDNVYAAREYATASQAFKPHVLGYMAAAWWDKGGCASRWIDGSDDCTEGARTMHRVCATDSSCQPRIYDTMERMREIVGRAGGRD